MRAKKEKSPLPQMVYVYEETDDDGNTFLIAARTVDETVDEDGGPRLVGKYWRGQEHMVELKVVSKRVRR